MTDKKKLEKLKKLADAMYYAAQQLTTYASRLHKAMDEYHQFIINEYHKEEPVSVKDCMYSKDNYTDEDRKVLCGGCEEECRFNKKEDSVSENYKNALNSVAITFLQEQQIVPNFYADIIMKAVKRGANWQKEKDQSTIELAEDHAMLAGMEKMKGQMMKEAVDGKIYETQARSKLKATTTGKISGLKYRAGDEVKIIIIKEE